METACASMRAAMYGSAVKVASGVTTIVPTPGCWVRAYGRQASVIATSVEARMAHIAPIAMKPRSGADKDSA